MSQAVVGLGRRRAVRPQVRAEDHHGVSFLRVIAAHVATLSAMPHVLPFAVAYVAGDPSAMLALLLCVPRRNERHAGRMYGLWLRPARRPIVMRV